MIIDYDNKILFVHIPRTSGTFLQNTLSSNLNNFKKYWGHDAEGDLSHIHYDRLVNYYETDVINNYKKICIVRNPYLRLMSAYIVRKPYLVKDKIIKNHNVSFSFFIKKILNIKNIHTNKYFIHFMPMYRFTHDKNFKSNMNHIFKHENFEIDFPKILELFGLKKDELKNINNDVSTPVKSGVNMNMINKLDKYTIRKINKLYKKDFDLFKYYMITK